MITHYKGELGEFDYDDNNFKVHYFTGLRYIGKESDGNKIHIPEGIKNCKYMFQGIRDLITPPVIPEGVEDCQGMFDDCVSLKEPPVIPEGVKYCTGMFGSCRELRSAPVIPQGVVDCHGMFSYCHAITKAPAIPKSVERCSYMFTGCTSLKEAPPIPEGVTSCPYMFSGCIRLEEAHDIPGSVKSCHSMFDGCINLKTAPHIQKGVQDTSSMFEYCISLKTAPAIPESVTCCDRMFRGCKSLTTAPYIPESARGNITELFYDCSRLVWDNIQGDAQISCDKLTGKRYGILLAPLLAGQTAESLFEKYKNRLGKKQRRLFIARPAASTVIIEMMDALHLSGADLYFKFYDAVLYRGKTRGYVFDAYCELLYSSNKTILQEMIKHKGQMRFADMIIKNILEAKSIDHLLKDAQAMYEAISAQHPEWLVCRNGKSLYTLDLIRMHDELSVIYVGIRAEEVMLHYDGDPYDRLPAKYGDIEIRYPVSTEEMRDIGKKMRNCVASYACDAANRKMTILCMTNAAGEYVGCIEADPACERLVQIKGPRNYALKGEYAEIIKKWIEEKKLGHDISDYENMA